MKTEKKQMKIIINEKSEKRSVNNVLNESANLNHVLKCNRLKPNMPEAEDLKKLKNK